MVARGTNTAVGGTTGAPTASAWAAASTTSGRSSSTPSRPSATTALPPATTTASAVSVRRPSLARYGLRPLDYDQHAAGEVLTARQAPHRPGTAPALGLGPEWIGCSRLRGAGRWLEAEEVAAGVAHLAGPAQSGGGLTFG